MIPSRSWFEKVLHRHIVSDFDKACILIHRKVELSSKHSDHSITGCPSTSMGSIRQRDPRSVHVLSDIAIIHPFLNPPNRHSTRMHVSKGKFKSQSIPSGGHTSSSPCRQNSRGPQTDVSYTTGPPSYFYNAPDSQTRPG